MFDVNPKTSKITMYQGDTGDMTVRARGYDFGPDDRVLFIVKDRGGNVKMDRVYTMTDNEWTVPFANTDTEDWDPDTYFWESRYVISPVYDGQKIVDGTFISTPGSPFEFQILKPLRKI